MHVSVCFLFGIILDNGAISKQLDSCMNAKIGKYSMLACFWLMYVKIKFENKNHLMFEI